MEGIKWQQQRRWRGGSDAGWDGRVAAESVAAAKGWRDRRGSGAAEKGVCLGSVGYGMAVEKGEKEGGRKVDICGMREAQLGRISIAL
ncbi:hypothetical protein RUM43_007972 [Polyplax serrata]|uniref:Uncharacterized protein n=1 Tax=Polyplax serrata TaxID=468196 RepID=A0AAN8PY92_POLSC